MPLLSSANLLAHLFPANMHNFSQTLHTSFRKHYDGQCRQAREFTQHVIGGGDGGATLYGGAGIEPSLDMRLWAACGRGQYKLIRIRVLMASRTFFASLRSPLVPHQINKRYRKEPSHFAVWYLFHLIECRTCLRRQFGDHHHTPLSNNSSGKLSPATSVNARGWNW